MQVPRRPSPSPAARRTGRTARFLGCLLTLAVLAGCSDADGGSAPPPAPPSSGPTSTGPSESTEPQPESAEGFIRRWAAANTEMQNSGKTTSFLSLSDGCSPCNDLAALVEQFYASGGYVRTDGWTVLSVAALAPRRGNRRVFQVDVNSRPTEYRESAEGPKKSLPGEQTQYQFTLEQLRGTWKVADYFEVST